MATCSAVDDCDKPAFRRGWCSMHYERWKSHGDFTTVKKPGKPRSLGNCTIDDGKGPCGRLAVAKGLCGKHWQRWKKFGDPTIKKLDRDRTPEERFWSFVDKDGPVPDYEPLLGPCWVWTGGLAEGYGAFSLEGRQIRAHRVAYIWLAGEIPEDCELDHLCRVRRCCNPAHLEPVSHLINVHRGTSPWAINAAKQRCGTCGFPYDAENTYWYEGGRYCRNCMRRRNREWWHRQKETGTG